MRSLASTHSVSTMPGERGLVWRSPHTAVFTFLIRRSGRDSTPQCRTSVLSSGFGADGDGVQALPAIALLECTGELVGDVFHAAAQESGAQHVPLGRQTLVGSVPVRTHPPIPHVPGAQRVPSYIHGYIRTAQVTRRSEGV